MEIESKQKDPDWIGNFYHVYNRGVERRRVFENDHDHQRFLLALASSNSSSSRRIHPSNLSHQGRTLVWINGQIPDTDRLVSIGAYCLMPNHFHLLVYERQAGGLAKFMQKLVTGYTMYFNKKYERTGALFQGKYKAKEAVSDQYLKYLFAYIHLNPIEMFQVDWKEVGIKDEIAAQEYLSAYRFSSYLDYIGHPRPEGTLIDKASFPEYFTGPNGFSEFVQYWLTSRVSVDTT